MSDLKFSRRDMLKFLAVPPLVSSSESLLDPFPEGKTAEIGDKNKEASPLDQTSERADRQLYSGFTDGPSSPHFKPLSLPGNVSLDDLRTHAISERMKKAIDFAPAGTGTAWGIPFHIGKKIYLIKDAAVQIDVQPFKAKWLVFMHATDMETMDAAESGFFLPPFKGEGRLGELVADYSFLYQDGTMVEQPIKRRRQIGMIWRRWGENCLEAVAPHKPAPIGGDPGQPGSVGWGWTQGRVNVFERRQWLTWLWAWENPHRDKLLKGFVLQPKRGTIILSAISAGDTSSHPLRWNPRQKALLTLPPQTDFDPILDRDGLLSQIQLDMGQVISAEVRTIYPNEIWTETYNNKVPAVSERELMIEFTSHPDAHFHVFGRTPIPVALLGKETSSDGLRLLPPADQDVRILIVEKGTKKPVAVKLHVHGGAGEYLAPVDRHRNPNPAWFEDYSVDFVHGKHNCTYIPGQTLIKLPQGKVFIEVSKGFEISPVRKVVDVTPKTKEITIELERVLPWRDKGWVTADTHVHFLSPGSALLEGAGEGVNVVNLLASQWGELMTNVGDFDGKTTLGSKQADGDGEFLVRVGTENRQHVLGHISLLGYEGQIIAPMCSGGPDESAIGDPIEVLLTEWARQCRKQGGIVVLPHFPNPRSEHAAAIISGDVDGVEMTSWSSLYGGIDPYSLSDWYRYLNCGYFVAAVGGTDKMTASTAVGTVRTYAKIGKDHPFDYNSWKDAIRKGNTFVTYGPLMEFDVDGRPPGTRIDMSRSGGTVDVSWMVQSCTVPMTAVELVVNGVIRERASVKDWEGRGHWSVFVDKSSWLALIIRGHYPDKPEIIAAHSSPIMVRMIDKEFYAAADAMTILDQIEGALAHLDTVGIRAADKTYKRMRMVLESAHRDLHNRMHQQGRFHHHSPVSDHHDR